MFLFFQLFDLILFLMYVFCPPFRIHVCTLYAYPAVASQFAFFGVIDMVCGSAAVFSTKIYFFLNLLHICFCTSC
jgi:hypothetical protein